MDEIEALNRTALFYCVENIDTSCMRQLIAANANVNLQDKNLYTCLHLAVISGNPIIVEYLLEHGAEVNMTDSDDHSVLHWAVVCGHTQLLDMLFKYGVNPDISDVHGAFPVHYAAQMCGDVEIWDETISRDPSKSRKFNQGNSLNSNYGWCIS